LPLLVTQILDPAGSPIGCRDQALDALRGGRSGLFRDRWCGSGCSLGLGPLGEHVHDLAQSPKLAELIRSHDRGFRERLLKRRQDLDPLDGVDAQVRVQIHRNVEHVDGISRLVRDHA